MSFMVEAFKPVSHQIRPKVQNPERVECAQWTHSPEFAGLNNTIAQTTGLRYEKRIEKPLTLLANELGFKLFSHKWINYNNGFFAQPDFVLASPSGAAILIEVKYTYTDTASQCKLYVQLLKHLGFNSIISCTICHNLTSETPRDRIIHDFHNLEQDSIWQLRI